MSALTVVALVATILLPALLVESNPQAASIVAGLGLVIAYLAYKQDSGRHR